MNNISNNKGSEWNIWDLHVHTPASYHWEGGSNFEHMTSEQVESSCQKIIEKINSSEAVAFSIVDYFTFDGFLKIRNFLQKNPSFLKKTLFPGIELRLEAPTNFRLNVQVIFSENIKNQELSDFKSTIKISHTDRPLSDEAIIEEAKKLPIDKAKIHIGNKDYKNKSDIAYKLGCKTIEIDKKSFKDAIENLGKNKCLVILPYETSDGICKLDWKKHPREDMYYLGLADFFESRKDKNIDLFLGKKTLENKNCFDNFQQAIGGKPKPVLSGSDAHKIEDYGNFPHEKKTWLKAEPTFKGLKQVTIEPKSRCFIGKEPEKLKTVKAKATKFISKIKIEKKPDSNLNEKWFDNELYFNSELIAIIGNKGSGKSALTDILGLLGSSKQHDSFSFLNNKKFKEKGDRCKAKDFIATLYWKNGSSNVAGLNDKVLYENIEKVKYIPQSYLEKLCNEISTKKNLFDRELKSVIFSHISSEERLEKESLDDLLKFKTEEINKEIFNLREDLKNVTKKILSNREKITEEYKKRIGNELSIKQKELEAVKNTKPKEILKPTDNSIDADTQEKVKQLELLKVKEQDIMKKIALLKAEVDSFTQKKAILDKAIAQIHILTENVNKKILEIKTTLEIAGYNDFNFFSFESKVSGLMNESARLNKELGKKKTKLYEVTQNLTLSDDCLEAQKQKIQLDIKKLSEQIDEPNKKYQNYLTEIKKWEKQIVDIEGNEHTPNTLGYLSSKLSELSNIPTKITEFEKQRDELVKAIYKKITQLAMIYKNYYNPVHKFIETNPFEREAFNISFNVSIVNNGFEENFFKMIDRSKAGTFYGEDGHKKMSQIISNYDFNNPENIVKFVRKVFYLLDNDCRNDNPEANKFELQIRKNILPEELYNMIFSLEYLEPEYFLQLNEKNLEQLSPGERGTLLLIFYLMVDKDDRPLILDQPEENLDNQTIFKVLVKCIKKAKERRQIFLVTHNPNLAVVCDAEQIIVASIDKKQDNAVSYHSGAIENPETNKKIIDILEGTKPAFQNRENKYHNV